MKFAYIQFYDLVYAGGWEDEELEIEDTIHTGIGILIEDKPTHVIVAMAMGNHPRQPFSRLLIPQQMIIKIIVIDEKTFTDRLMINGYGKIPDEDLVGMATPYSLVEINEKTCNCNNE